MGELRKTKIDLLEILWRAGKPINVRDIAKKADLKMRSVNMHLINMRRSGHVSSVGSGLYIITDLGKKALGFPEIDVEKARKILSPVPQEKAFKFYKGINEPLEVSSSSLKDFLEKIKEVDVKSIEFHASRGDFELWIHFLGDVELAKRLRIIRELNLSGEELRDEIYSALKSRYEYLEKTSAGTASTN
ncbi:MAG: DUF5752 family protein [Candidatus Bathyarchaeia archaeon]